MLATFVIGLREGLEASLIVGIIAAFLKRQGRVDLLRVVYAGVALAVALCAGVGVALRIASRDLPQREQEGLETVIGVVAVAMVTYMVVWMRRNSRQLKGTLEAAADRALTSGSGWALVAMAFLAVLREGFETAVFLLAAMNENTSGGYAPLGALLGVLVAVGLGYGIYRGGVRLNLSKFFRATGVVLALVAAGLVASALHTAHEAGWLNDGQQSTVDLSSVVGAGTVQGALLTGVLGIQPRPVLAEVLGWLAFLLVVGPYVAWPPGRKLEPARAAQVAAGGAATALAAGVALLLAAPQAPVQRPTGRLDGVSARLVSTTGSTATVALTLPAGWGSGGSGGSGVAAGGSWVAAGGNGNGSGGSRPVTLARTGGERVGGVAADVFGSTTAGSVTDQPDTLPRAQVAALNGGRLPLGVDRGATQVPVSYQRENTLEVWLEPRTGRVLDVRAGSRLVTRVRSAAGPIALADVRGTVNAPSRAAVWSQASSAGTAVAELDRRWTMRTAAAIALTFAAMLGVLALAVAARWLAARSARNGPATGDVGEGAAQRELARP